MKDSSHEGILRKSHVSHTCFRRDHDAGYYWPCPQQSWVVGRAKFSFSHICSANVELVNLNSIHQLTLFQHRKDITQKPCTASRFIRCDYRITSPCYDGKLFNNTVYHQLHLKLCVNFTLAQWFPHSPTVQVQTQIHTLQQEYPGITLHDPMQPSKRKWAQHWPSSLKFHNAKNPCCREPPEEPHQ